MPGLPPYRGWDPFREFHREVGRIIGSLTPRAGRLRAYPPLNLYETDAAYLVTADVPGMDAGSLDLSLAGETLTLRGERQRPESIPEETYRRQERFTGRWSRSLTLPGRVDGDAVSAHYSDGILTITLPKAEESRARQIAVTTST